MSRVVLASLVLAVALAGGGCTSSKVEDPTYSFGLFPNVAHSGFNSSASFKVMFATGATNPVWTVADPSIATIVPSAAPTIPGVNTKDLRFGLVTTLKDGQTTISVSSGGQTLTSQLIVKAYTNDQLAAGKARYENMDPANDPARPPCAGCHQKPGGVDHSPLKMAGFDDGVILGVIQDATYPATASGQSTTSAFSPTGPLTLPAGVTHKWNLTDPEKDGILAHLRSLPLGGVE